MFAIVKNRLTGKTHTHECQGVVQLDHSFHVRLPYQGSIMFPKEGYHFAGVTDSADQADQIEQRRPTIN